MFLFLHLTHMFRNTTGYYFAAEVRSTGQVETNNHYHETYIGTESHKFPVNHVWPQDLENWY